MRFLESMRGVLTSCSHAGQGVLFALRSQRNFKIHTAVGGAVLGAGIALSLSRTEMAILVATISLVIMGELLNTSLEYLLNLLEARNHPVARAVKDVAAGAVLLAVCGSVVVGILLFGPRLAAVFASR